MDPSRSPASSLTGLVVFERFEVTAPLASEPRGETYLGVALEGGAPVVLRFLSHPVFSHAARSTWGAIGDRFEQLCALDDPHLERVITGGIVRRRSEDLLCVVTERVEGVALSSRLKPAQRISMREALTLARGVAQGLRAAHAAGVVHGDLRASNILLAQGRDVSPWPVLTDVGLNNLLAAALGGDLSMRELAWSADAAAPEQIRGEPATPETDVYALGMLLYRALTGALPFACETASEVLIAQLSRPPIPLKERGLDAAPASLEALVAQCLAKAPRERFSSMDAFLSALEVCADEVSGRVSEAPKAPRASLEPARGEGADDTPSQSGLRSSSTRLISDARARRASQPGEPVERAPTGQAPRFRGLGARPTAPPPPPEEPRAQDAPPAGAVTSADATVRTSALHSRGDDVLRTLRPLFLAVVGLALLSGLLGGYVLATLQRPPVTTTTFAARSSTRAVRVRVHTNVAEAQIALRGRTYDAPVSVEVAPGVAPEMIEVSARGYETRRLWMPINEHVDAQIDLVAQAPTAQPAAAQPEAETSPRRGRHGARAHRPHRSRRHTR